jgi:hypothetical protein
LGPAAAAINDFSGDGSPDIAVVLQIDKKVVVYGKGLRRYIFFPTSAIHEECSSIMPYDFNGDGLMDLLLTNYGNLAASVYLNQGGAKFAASDSFATQSFPYLESVVDLTGDGMEDLVYIQYFGGHVSLVMLNRRDGSISSMGNMVLDSSLYYVLGDFNLDGIVDISIARRR